MLLKNKFSRQPFKKISRTLLLLGHNLKTVIQWGQWTFDGGGVYWGEFCASGGGEDFPLSSK